MIRLVVFDCDGTLVDSQQVIVTCMAGAFEREGLAAPPAEAIRRIVGLTLHHAVAELAPEVDAGAVDRLVEGYKAQFAEVQREASVHETLYPGARDILEALNAAGFLLAIATGKGRRGLAATLARHDIAHHFAALKTADDAPSKPHPGMLLQAMEEAGAEPNETVLVGDTTFDIEMAVGAGAVPIGVTWGYHPTETLVDAGAATVISRFDELMPFITIGSAR